MTDRVIMARSLSENDWNSLLDRINRGNCTPFIGPGARADVPDGHEIASTWAERYKYQMGDCQDLPKVARYVSVQEDVARPKELIAELFNRIEPPDFSLPENRDDPHRVLAGLPLPVYITTNYDNYMWRALNSLKAKEPRMDFCRWNSSIPDLPLSVFDRSRNPPYDPNAANPIIFHLYGHPDCLESLVVSDDDYLEFLISISKDQSSKDKRMIPARIERAMTGSALLLLGYRLDDWDFRVLFHVLISVLPLGFQRTSVAVQLAPAENESEHEQQEKLQKHLEVYQTYLDKYFRSKRLDIRVYLQTCQDFVGDLRDRWRNSPYANP